MMTAVVEKGFEVRDTDGTHQRLPHAAFEIPVLLFFRTAHYRQPPISKCASLESAPKFTQEASKLRQHTLQALGMASLNKFRALVGGPVASTNITNVAHCWTRGSRALGYD